MLEKSKYAICLNRNDVSFYIEMGSSANGNMRRIINFFLMNLQKQQTKYKSGIKNFKSELMILQMNLK